jgi:hypothetical protein
MKGYIKLPEEYQDNVFLIIKSPDEKELCHADFYCQLIQKFFKEYISFEKQKEDGIKIYILTNKYSVKIYFCKRYWNQGLIFFERTSGDFIDFYKDFNKLKNNLYKHYPDYFCTSYLPNIIDNLCF